MCSRSVAEQEDLSRLLDCIFKLSETQNVIGSHDAHLLDLHCQASKLAAQSVSPGEKQRNALPAKRQGSVRKCKVKSEQTFSPLSDPELSASPQKESLLDEEHELFQLDSPILGGFQGKHMSLETPMHWLFY